MRPFREGAASGPHLVRCSRHERHHCSDRIWNAYRASGEGDDLGPLVRLGDLRRQPFEETIRQFEQGPPPLDREMITPRDLAASPKLDVVFAFRIATPQPGK